MKKIFTIVFIALILPFVGCSGDDEKTDLAQELAAKKMLAEIEKLVKQNKMAEANEASVTLETKYGHTTTYFQSKASLMQKGVFGADYKNAITGQKLVEIENKVLTFLKEMGRWPQPAEVKTIHDSWGRDLYWIAGSAKKSYDMLFLSAGPDGIRGTGDELILVWAEEDLGGYKDKKTGEIVGQTKKTKKKKAGAGGDTPAVITLEELAKREIAAGVPKEDVTTLEGLRKSAGSRQNDGEVIMSLGEIKGRL